MVVLEGGGMLSTGGNQYLQPDYLSPLPTTVINFIYSIVFFLFSNLGLFLRSKYLKKSKETNLITTFFREVVLWANYV